MATLDKDFTAVGAGTGLSVANGDSFTYDVAGTFEGTVVLERTLNGGQTWERVGTFTEAASGTVEVETSNGQPAVYRFRCDLFTSGTIETSIADAAVSTGDFGGGVITTTEAGATVTGTLAVSGAITSGAVAVPTISSTSTLTNKTLTAPVLSGTATGTYTLGGTPTITAPTLTGTAAFADLSGSGLTLTKAGFAGSVALTIGVDSTHGLQVKQIDEVVDLTDAGATSVALTTPVPAGAVILSAQANVDALVVAGGTTVKVALGLAAGDVDKYGISSDLTLNQKINKIPDWAVLAAEEAIAVCGVVTDGSALGDSNITAGAVHVRIVYIELASLANAS